jgi:hypothetical protein
VEEPLDKPNRAKLPLMRLQVFVSSPTKLSPEQDDVRSTILGILDDEGLAPRTLGLSDSSGGAVPLAQICVIANHCVGGVILGFEQMHVTAGTLKRRARNDQYVDVSKRVEHPLRFPTAWNQIETAILFALGKPLLIMCDDGIDDGVFFSGAAGKRIYTLPANGQEMTDQEQGFRQVIKDWRSDVAKTYKDAWQFAGRY